MGYYSGKWAVIDGQSTVRNFTLNHISTPFMYRASNTVGGSARVDGTKDWSGTFDQLGGVPALMPGDIFAGQFYTAPQTGNYGGDGLIFTGNAIVDSVAINWNWGTGEAVNINYTFSGSGVLNSDVGPNIVDATSPQEFPICAAKIDYGAAASEADLSNVLSATLTLTAENVGSVNSSTNCYVVRVAGPIDWTAAIVLEDDTAPIPIGTTERFRFFIDGTDFFELKWGIVRDYSGLTADRESGAIISQTMNLDMDGIDGTGDVGSITLPGAGTPWWPPEATTTAVTVAGVNEPPAVSD